MKLLKSTSQPNKVERVEVRRRIRVSILLRVYQVMKQAEIETRVGDLGYA
jgi:hypothetical protein